MYQISNLLNEVFRIFNHSPESPISEATNSGDGFISARLQRVQEWEQRNSRQALKWSQILQSWMKYSEASGLLRGLRRSIFGPDQGGKAYSIVFWRTTKKAPEDIPELDVPINQFQSKLSAGSPNFEHLSQILRRRGFLDWNVLLKGILCWYRHQNI